MHAGPEVSVASTKAYTSMLTAFGLLALLLGRTRDLSVQRGSRLVVSLQALPLLIQQVLQLDKKIAAIASKVAKAHSAFFIGRTDGYPVALEGAQKLKEISYIHAEAYPASELKHGPLALVTDKTPCIVILQDSDLIAKNISSLEEINARGAPIIAVTDSDEPRIKKLAADVLKVPTGDNLLQPIVMGVVLQLLAYHCAVKLKRDVDQPRNLAKSVTVE
jgi:glucosamine--fructose-6-phosphate aminotransferase (isomerizing)